MVNRLDDDKEFKDSVLGMIPKDWDVETIKSCLEKGIIIDIQDGNHGEAHPKNSDFIDDGVPFIMAKDLGNGKINIETCHKIAFKQYQSLRIGFAKPGDILLSHKGTIGLTTIVPDDLHHLMLTPQVTYYRLSKDSTIVKEFLFYFFQSYFFQTRLEVLSAQSTRSYIGITLQKTLKIIIPPIPEQQQIAEILDTVDKAIA
ncbi:MAG: restriction endonuclease subunit S [Dolichospermum sp. BR01]|nr:restriction endonuclease subunit S [Dolichospermum sp. BR01]